jgi:uncharacterized protein YjbJ (UPF0337 family)
MSEKRGPARSGKPDELRGRAQETVGHVTADPEMEREGRARKTKGRAKQAADKARDAIRGVTRRG